MKNWCYMVGDFETTVEDNQNEQEWTMVWSSAFTALFDESETVDVLHTMKETMQYLSNMEKNTVVYYHNLKFDGSFYIDYMLRNGFTLALVKDKNGNEYLKKEKDLIDNEYTYLYTDTGLMYVLTVKLNGKIIKLVDSYKILPFSLDAIGKSFKTKHRKLKMEYKGDHYPGCVITEEEMAYIKNDVLVLKESMEIMHMEEHKRITIGSNCIFEYKRIFKEKIQDGFFNWRTFFPDLYEHEIDGTIYGETNAGDYIRKSYRGGWVYLKKGYENKIVHNGATFDVNSEYPSNMHSISENSYPVGNPYFWLGDIPEEAERKDRYFFITIRCNFKLKENHLPFIQIKRDKRYNPREMLETSDIRLKDGSYIDIYIDYDGNERKNIVEMTLTMTDYYRFLEYYDVYDFEVLHGCWFYSFKGLFDYYIDKYMEQKMTSEGAKRTLAKLFLNNLYGKFATGTDSSFKVFELDMHGNVVSRSIRENDKIGGYIPIGSAITSYSRDFIIRHSQENYNNFIYADTDSIHMLGREAKGLDIDPVKLNCWKCESYWDTALFVRAKTYIEHVTHTDMTELEEPYYDVKCAGLPERCKMLFLESCGIETNYDFEKLSPDEEAFLADEHQLTDFKAGLTVPGKLKQKRIKGGIILREEFFVMKK